MHCNYNSHVEKAHPAGMTRTNTRKLSPRVRVKLNCRTSSKPTSREAIPTAPVTPASVTPNIESFLIVGLSRVAIAPLLSVTRTADGCSTGINASGLTAVACQL